MIDKAIHLVKCKAARKILIKYIILSKVLKRFVENIEVRKEFYTQKMNNFFLAVKFKVSYVFKFQRKYGFSFDKR